MGDKIAIFGEFADEPNVSTLDDILRVIRKQNEELLLGTPNTKENLTDDELETMLSGLAQSELSSSECSTEKHE